MGRRRDLRRRAAEDGWAAEPAAVGLRVVLQQGPVRLGELEGGVVLLCVERHLVRGRVNLTGLTTHSTRHYRLYRPHRVYRLYRLCRHYRLYRSYRPYRRY